MQVQTLNATKQHLSNDPVRVTVAHGDGIGRDIMDATLSILEAAGAKLTYYPITIGKEMYLNGHKSGIAPAAWEILRNNPVFLKGPITTPQGGGYKSLNVTIRKSMGLYANIRPVRTYTPFVESHFPQMDVVVVRENEEDLYAGIEHQQTPEVVQCLKLVSRTGCERIVRYAFEYARVNGRKKVTCMTKDNIMKHTDGLFHEVFKEVAVEYPNIESDHYIIDIGTAKLAANPEHFDVIVTLNLYGDIISDVTAEIAGSVGLGGSANIGDSIAMFEAIHGSAPDIADQGIANPSGLIQAACMMLTHVGQGNIAQRITNALLKTLEDGIHTADLYSDSYTQQGAATHEFAQAVIDRLGQQPDLLKAEQDDKILEPIQIILKPVPRASKKMVGVDLFLDWDASDRNPEVLGKALEELASPHFKLKMITNRGVKVYPQGFPETYCTDHWRCRFVSHKAVITAGNTDLSKSAFVQHEEIISLLYRLASEGYDCIKTENLYEINGKRAYSLGQGE